MNVRLVRVFLLLTLMCSSCYLTYFVLAQDIIVENAGTPVCHPDEDQQGNDCYELSCGNSGTYTPYFKCDGAPISASLTGITKCEVPPLGTTMDPDRPITCKTKPPHDTNSISFGYVNDTTNVQSVSTTEITCPHSCERCAVLPNGDGLCPRGRYKDNTTGCCREIKKIASNEQCQQAGGTWNFANNNCQNQYACPIPDLFGICPSGTSEDAFGWCCGQAGCEGSGWIWNFASTLCQEPPQNSCSSGQSWNSQAGQCCTDPPPEYQCDAIIPETNCPYNFAQGCGPSPILVDVAGNGFQMTNAVDGVNFDIDGNSDQVRERLSWTQAATDDAWLVLDRNGNGSIESGREMFGNYTSQSQPIGTARNGFLALAAYDKAAKGGNGDGVINKDDDVFKKLRLWQDTNHNGVSEPSELHKLKEPGLKTLDLDYKESKKTDQYGNQFRYRAKVKDTHGAQLGRWAWDVFLVMQ
jgi:hypothetical protein